MLLITCPWCGERDQSEFSYGGEAHIARPANSHELSDEQWAEFVFMRNNPKGIFNERWMHAAGCRRWFNAVRDTSNDRFWLSTSRESHGRTWRRSRWRRRRESRRSVPAMMPPK